MDENVFYETDFTIRPDMDAKEITEKLNALLEEVAIDATATERERCAGQLEAKCYNYIGYEYCGRCSMCDAAAAIRKGETPAKIARTELYFEGETHELKKGENDEPTA
jgi:hypothetical protein